MRPDLRSRSMTSGREARSAGTSPNTIADTSAAPAANVITTGSIPTCRRRGRFSGPSASNSRMPTHAEPDAGDGAGPASTTLSASSWRTSRARRAAERRPHRQLALARGGADEQQVRDVGARDEQHERHRPHERQDRGPDVGDEILVHRLDAEVHACRLLDGKLRAQARRHASSTSLLRSGARRRRA